MAINLIKHIKNKLLPHLAASFMQPNRHKHLIMSEICFFYQALIKILIKQILMLHIYDPVPVISIKL